MEKENKKILLRLLDKNKTIKKWFVIFFLISILGNSLSIIIENRKYPDAIELNQVAEDNQYVKCKIKAIYELNTENINEDKTVKDYYLATDGTDVYILEIGKAQYDILTYALNNDEYTTIPFIYGMRKDISANLKQLAVNTYSQIFENSEVNIDNFNEYFIPYLIDVKVNPNSSAQIFNSIGLISGIIVIIIGIYCIFIMVKNRKRIDKLEKDGMTQEILNQVLDSSKIEYERCKMMFLKDYLISYLYGIEIINYDDIMWMYPYNYGVYGIVTNKRIIIITKDKKQYVLANAFAFGKKNKEQYEKCMEEIVKRRPNILVGYTPENIVAMNDENFKDTINSVTKK